MYSKGDGILGKSPLFNWMCFLLIGMNAFSIATAEYSHRAAGIREIIGEIVAINAETVRVTHDGMTDDYKLTADSQITCNGLSATWQGLRPITPQAFFEARLLVNDEGQIIAVDGSYRGEECILLGWFYKSGHLWLQLGAAQKNQTQWKVVKTGARQPEEGWLYTGQDLFVVYDRVGEIRGIYVPD
ncbi:MAG TPA: hypothetical protein DDW50_22765 [Firmicutes bacterium]|jgi:hypothetical protein|nr:hypothetical protein [Bacillota bacterium]